MEMLCATCGNPFELAGTELGVMPEEAICSACKINKPSNEVALELDVSPHEGLVPQKPAGSSKGYSTTGPLTFDLDEEKPSSAPSDWSADLNSASGVGGSFNQTADVWSGEPEVIEESTDVVSDSGEAGLHTKVPAAEDNNKKPNEEINPAGVVSTQPSNNSAASAVNPLTLDLGQSSTPKTPAQGLRVAPPLEIKTQPSSTAALASKAEQDSDSPWRLYLAVVGTAVLAVFIGLIVSFIRSRPPPPPEIPNPMAERVANWKAAEVALTHPDLTAALKAAESGLASLTDTGLRKARVAARSALILDHTSAAGIALFGRIIAVWPDRIEEELIGDLLGATTSAVGADPEGLRRVNLEESRAWLLLRQARPDAARQAAEKALALKPEAASLKMLLAVTRIASRPEQALSELEALKKASDAPPDLPLWLGDAMLAAGKPKLAKETWRGMLNGGQRDANVFRRLSRYALNLGDLTSAASELNSILAVGGGFVEDRLLLARIAVSLDRDPQAALNYLNQGLADVLLDSLSRARLLTEKVAIALVAPVAETVSSETSKWLDQALDAAPDLPELLYVAGISDGLSGLFERAIESLEAAYELAPNQPEVVLALAWFSRLKSADLARQVLSSAMGDMPHYIPLHLLRAAIELEAENRREALLAIKRGLDFDPQDAHAGQKLDEYSCVTLIYKELAKLLAKHATKTDNPMIHTAAGVAYYIVSDTSRANKHLSRAARLDTSLAGARIYRAIMAQDRGQIANSQRELKVALTTDSQHRVARYYQARLLEEQSKFGEAERLYQELLYQNPLDLASRIGLARALNSKGGHSQARQEALRVLASRSGHREALLFFENSQTKPKPSNRVRPKAKKR